MKGDSRSEMRNVRDLINKKDYKKIAAEIRKMKRLWIGRGLDGLIQRREDEAALVESCI
jgi:GH24 family phage-related lysozyme (muramidase)